MRILESSPNRYDKGIDILTLGKMSRVYNRVIEHIKKDHKVLDIGCGTGRLVLQAALKGAKVKGIDINSQMLEIARKRCKELNLLEKVDFVEMGVAELNSESDNSFDVVMSTLCFSELSDFEIDYALIEIRRILKQDGLLLIADENKSNNTIKNIINFSVKLPLIIITYLISQTTTKAVKQLEKRVEEKGLKLISIKKTFLENFIEIIAQKEGSTNE